MNMSGLMPNEPDTLLVKMTVADCADYCLRKFPKNPPTRKDAVIRSIRTAFNFKADVSDEFAEKIYQKMKNKKCFAEDGNKVIWTQTT